MVVQIEIVSKLTNKTIEIYSNNGVLFNTTYSGSNETVLLSHDSYVFYLSNPITQSSFTNLLQYTENVFTQILLFIFIIVVAFLYVLFIKVVKEKGIRGF